MDDEENIGNGNYNRMVKEKKYIEMNWGENMGKILNWERVGLRFDKKMN
jgi:hypothetical protein